MEVDLCDYQSCKDYLANRYLNPSRCKFLEQVTDRISCKDGDNVLDLGCGPAYMLKLLTQKYKIKAFALDYIKTFLRYAKEEMGIPAEFKLCNLYETGYEDNFFDWIICTQVFEHLEEPQKAIKEMLRISKIGGKILLTIPDGDRDTEKRHINYWSKKQFEVFLKDAGCFTIVEMLEGDYPRLIAIITVTDIPKEKEKNV